MILQKSVSASAITSPSWSEEKHIHFNEQVEQSLALDDTDNDDKVASLRARSNGHNRDSDDGAVMVKSTHSNRKFQVRSGSDATPHNSCNVHSKTITMLPSIRLKNMEGTPQPLETVTKRSNGFQHSGRLSPPLPQEAVRRSSLSTFSLLESDDEDGDADMDWQSWGSFANCEDSDSVAQEPLQNLQFAGNPPRLDDKPSGFRRTSSEVLIFHRDKDDAISDGLFGRAANILNTAWDIAYMIWIGGQRR